MKNAIKKAIEGGYMRNQILKSKQIGMRLNFLFPSKEETLLDPKFWLALGKALGWKEEKFYSNDGIHPTGVTMSEAQWYSRCFWNHIWEEKPIDEFFEELLDKKK